MINSDVANFMAKAVLLAAEQYEKRTGKAALRFLIELPGDPPAPERPAIDDISLNLSHYSVDVEILDAPTEPT
jgi:hypothetical protein